MDDFQFETIINYDTILGDKRVPHVVKDLARTMKNHGMITVGQWLRDLSTYDLLGVMNASNTTLKEVNKIDPLQFQTGTHYILIALILSQGEGLTDSSQAVIQTRLALLDSYLTAEMIKRRGFDIEIFYENMSLSEDCKDGTAHKPIVRVGDKMPDQYKVFLEVLLGPDGLRSHLPGAHNGPPNTEGIKALVKKLNEGIAEVKKTSGDHPGIDKLQKANNELEKNVNKVIEKSNPEIKKASEEPSEKVEKKSKFSWSDIFKGKKGSEPTL